MGKDQSRRSLEKGHRAGQADKRNGAQCAEPNGTYWYSRAVVFCQCHFLELAPTLRPMPSASRVVTSMLRDTPS